MKLGYDYVEHTFFKWTVLCVAIYVIVVSLISEIGARFWQRYLNHVAVLRAMERSECAECGYSLKGLTEPRCPECGTPFAATRMEEAG